MSTSSNPMYISGLATGIDTDSMITKLMQLEARPKDLLTEQMSLITGKQSVYSTLGTKLATLQSLVTGFKDLGTPFFSQMAGSSTVPAVADLRLTGSAPAAGTYALEVLDLATAARVAGGPLYTGVDRVALPAVSSSAAVINAPASTVDANSPLAAQAVNFSVAPQTSGSFTVNGVSISWDDGMSLNQVLGRVNNSGAGVTATFDAASQRVAFTSAETGGPAEVTLGQSSGNLLEALQLAPGTVNGTDAVSVNYAAALGSSAAQLDEPVTSGTFTLNGVIFYVDAATDSLRTVLERINGSGAGVKASYDSASQTVILSQTRTGSGRSIVLGAAGDTSNLWHALKLSASVPPTGGPGDTYAGSDARFSVNGGPVQTAAENTLTGVVPDATIDLNGTGTTTLQVRSDIDSMVERIQGFVDAYNAVIDLVNAKSREERVEDATTVAQKLQGAFIADPLFRDVKASLTSDLTAVVSGRPGEFNQFAQIGISTSAENFGKDAKLELDEEKLRAALTQHPDEVEAMFNQTGDGIMTRLEAQLRSFTDLVHGGVTLQQTALTETNHDLQERITSLEESLARREENMRLRFTAMETLVAKLNSMGSQLTQMLGQMNSGSQ